MIALVVTISKWEFFARLQPGFMRIEYILKEGVGMPFALIGSSHCNRAAQKHGLNEMRSGSKMHVKLFGLLAELKTLLHSKFDTFIRDRSHCRSLNRKITSFGNHGNMKSSSYTPNAIEPGQKQSIRNQTNHIRLLPFIYRILLPLRPVRMCSNTSRLLAVDITYICVLYDASAVGPRR